MSVPRRQTRPTMIGVVVAVLAVVLAGLAVPTATAAPDRAAPDQAAPDGADQADKIAPSVLSSLRDDGAASFWVRFADRTDLSAAAEIDDWAARGRAVYDALTATAVTSQAKARVALDAAEVDYTPYWVSNAIYVKDGSPALAQLLAADAEVSALIAPTTYRVPEPAKAETRSQVDSVGWNVAAVNADDVWSLFGATGNGIVVANIDTGVQYSHPAVVGQYRGNAGSGLDHNYNWFDPSRVCSTAEPCDNHGHGTHTMGTMVGDDGAANQIGVAPGARWIAAKGCETNDCSDAALLSSAQWMLAPTDLNGTNPRPDLRPHVVNNSWGGEPDNPWFDDVLRAWRAAGIFPAFSNGNDGPGCDTAGSPGDSQLAYGVGALDSAGRIAGFSSRGPGVGGATKPNISAPGAAVRSSVPGGYVSWNGTSMAAPHVAAAVALLWSAAPDLTGDVAATEALLDRTATDVEDTTCGGTAADNNVYGEGRLDALAAVQGAPLGPTGTLRGTVTDAQTGAPVANALVTAVAGPHRRSARTGEDGSYTMTLPPGHYQITAAAFAYRDATATGTVTTDQTTTVDLAVDPLPAYTVRGQVTQASGRPVAGATVAIAGTLVAATTDDRGRYRLDRVPAGEHTVVATPAATDNCLQATQRIIRVQQDRTEDFQLGHATDTYGYTCGYEPTAYIEADTPVSFDGHRFAPVELPFPVDLYQRSYHGRTAYVNPQGRLFLNESGNPGNPEDAEGNWGGDISVFSDLLKLVEGSRIATKTAGTAPNRTFTVEWRDIGSHLDPRFSIDFEVTFHEDGDIVFAYRDIDPTIPLEAGSNAVVWIAGLFNSTTGWYLTASWHEATLTNDRQIRFTLPPNGTVTGTVTDANDGRPVANAPVQIINDRGERVQTHLLTDDNGRYRARLFPGQYNVTVAAHGYQPQTTSIDIRRDRQVRTVNARLQTGIIRARPEAVDIELNRRGDGKAELTLTNRGGTDLTWRAAEIDGPTPAHQPGDELGSWGTGDFLPGGVAVMPNGNLWVSGGDWGTPGIPQQIREYRPDGSPTGVVHDPLAKWGLPRGTALDDLAYLPAAGLLCVTSYLFDNTNQDTIYCFDPATGDLRRTLHLGQLRHGVIGLAYDAHRDVFYVTGDAAQPVFTGGITTIAGFGHSVPGAVIAACTVDFQAAGAAYHPTSRTLWIVGDANPHTEQQTGYWIHQVDPATCLTVSRFNHERGWSTAMDLDTDGNLLTGAGSAGNRFYGIVRFASGDPLGVDAPWLALSRDQGVLRPQQSTTITVRADLPAWGTDGATATVRLIGNAGRDWDIRVPVTTTPWRPGGRNLASANVPA